MRLRLSSAVLLALGACAHDVPRPQAAAVPAAQGQPAKAATAAKPKNDPLAEDVAGVSRSLAAYLYSQDEALWTQWTLGAPLYDAEALRTRHPNLFRADAVLTARQARAGAGADPRALAHLEGSLAGLQISVAAAGSETALANLEASLTFDVEGRDVPWRDLMRLLANEPSALKRKGLWAGSHRAAERLGALIDARDAAVARAHRALSLEPDVFSEARLELDLDAVAELAEAVLTRTEAEWKAVLERRAREDLKLTLDRVSRADLPRLMRPDARADAAFPKEQQAARARALLEGLGLAELPGLALALDESKVKGVLPLSLLAGPEDARVAVRPRAGLRSQAAVLSELGRAVALHGGSNQRFEYARLGAPVIADVTGALFESLLGHPGWLTAQGLSPELAQTAARAWTDGQLFDARREAALVLATNAAHELGAAEAQEQWRTAMARALALPVPPEEVARWKLELEAGLLPAHHLRVRALAAALAARLATDFGATWWKNPEAARALRALWSSGTAVPLDDRLRALGPATEPWLAALGGKPAAPVADAGTWPAAVAPRAIAGPWAPPIWGPRSLAAAPPSPPRSKPDGGARPDGGT
jgi:hypothetical protein